MLLHKMITKPKAYNIVESEGLDYKKEDSKFN